MELRSNSVLVIQTSTPMTIKETFNPLTRNTHYEFFQRWSSEVQGRIHPETPLLVLTSHTATVNPFEIAREVKSINRWAVVVAYTGNYITPDQLKGSLVDTLLYKLGLKKGFEVRLIEAFLTEALNWNERHLAGPDSSRERLIRMINETNRESPFWPPNLGL